jgi:aryl carrier-like protein
VVTTTAGVAIDYLAHQQAWLPVFLPLPVEPPPVAAGTRIDVRWSWAPDTAPRCPDYHLAVRIDGLQCEVHSHHHETARGATPLHRRLLPAAPPLAVAPGDLRAWLARHLPEPLLPNAWMYLQALPLNANGKLDRPALPAPPARAERTWGGHGGPPRTALESDLAGIWSEVLGVAALGVQDNFFALGGDSIAAVRTISRIQQLLDDGVMLAALFEAPTIAAMARYLGERHAPALARRYGPAAGAVSGNGDARGGARSARPRQHGEL